MIRINKPAQVPEKLAIDGKAETEKNKQLYEQFEEEYKCGQREFEIKASIYGHKTVKDALKKAQYHKCCFCEIKVKSGDVEHFRPKSGYQQNEKDNLSKPGYYWLAYEWDNMLYCCPDCNRSYKRNLFPLIDDSKRAKSHSDNIDQEEPLFIHPGKENPEDFIEYKREEPRAINNDQRGKATIEQIINGNKELLDELRLTKYNLCKSLYLLIKRFKKIDELKALIKDAKQELEKAVKDSAEYALMMRCAIKDKFRY